MTVETAIVFALVFGAIGGIAWRVIRSGVQKLDHAYAPLRLLAQEMASGRIFTDRHAAEQGLDSQQVFLPFVFISGEEHEKLMQKLAPNGAAGPFGMIYEYVNRAGPRTVNGCPVFHSFKVLSPFEAAYVIAHHDVLVERLNALKTA